MGGCSGENQDNPDSDVMSSSSTALLSGFLRKVLKNYPKKLLWRSGINYPPS